jgi:imidazolonepropionase-like amidohydrolase
VVGLSLLALLAWALRAPTPLPSPGRGLELARVTLVDPGSGRRAPASLHIEGERIASIGPAETDPSDPFRDSFVLPGLTDMHIHLPFTRFPGDAEYTALLLLRHGVTSARVCGGTAPNAMDELRTRIETGEVPGPRFFSCGPIVDGADPVLPDSRSVSDPGEAIALVEELATRGVDCIKAYHRLDSATTVALREAAHAHGLPIIGHTPQNVAFEEARLDDVQHLRGVHPPFDGERLSYPHFLAAWRRMDEDRLAHVIAVSLRYDMAHTPTLAAIEGTLVSRDWESWRRTPAMQMWAPHLRDGLWSGEVGFNPVRFMADRDFETVQLAFEQMQRTVRRLHAAGVRLHTGTDSNAPNLVPGASLHRELELFVEAGLTPEQALELSTGASPAFLGIDAAGELREGAPADLLIFREDPSRDLAALETLEAVVRDGRLYTREDLDARLMRYRAHYDGIAFSRLLMPVLRVGLRLATAWLRS